MMICDRCGGAQESAGPVPCAVQLFVGDQKQSASRSFMDAGTADLCKTCWSELFPILKTTFSQFMESKKTISRKGFYDRICKAAHERGGWYNGAVAVVSEIFPGLSSGKIDEMVTKCGCHRASSDSGKSQGSMTPKDYEHLELLLNEVKKAC